MLFEMKQSDSKVYAKKKNKSRQKKLLFNNHEN